MGYLSGGFCYASVDLAARDFASRYPITQSNNQGDAVVVSVNDILNPINTTPTGSAQLKLTISSFGITARKNTVIDIVDVGFPACSGVGTVKTGTTDAFLYYVPTTADIAALSVALIGFPLLAYTLGMGFKNMYRLIMHGRDN